MGEPEGWPPCNAAPALDRSAASCGRLFGMGWVGDSRSTHDLLGVNSPHDGRKGALAQVNGPRAIPAGGLVAASAAAPAHWPASRCEL